jgi:hypothetical protein
MGLSLDDFPDGVDSDGVINHHLDLLVHFENDIQIKVKRLDQSQRIWVEYCLYILVVVGIELI